MIRRLSIYLLFSLTAAVFFAFSGTGTAWAAAVYGPQAITDDATGGKCVEIGYWNDATNTCTLAADLEWGYSEQSYDGLVIGSDNIILDGNGFTIKNFISNGTGVGLNNRTGVTIKNLRIEKFYTGINIIGGSNNTLKGNTIGSTVIGIDMTGSTSNAITGNDMNCSGNMCIYLRPFSANNQIRNNRLANLSTFTSSNFIMLLEGATDNIISGNTFDTTGTSAEPLRLQPSSNDNIIYMNNFVSDDLLSSNINVDDDAFGNSFYLQLPPPYNFFGWGNYWSSYDSPGETCNDNVTPDVYCDQLHYVPGDSSATDNYPFNLRAAWGRYDFTWYDDAGASNWILAANTDPSSDVWADIYIAGQKQDMPALAGYAAGQVPPHRSVASKFAGVKGGPVRVESRDGQAAVVSQRILWGNSLDEIPGINGYDLSDTYWWPWYDMASPGFKNWVLVANPNTFNVYVEIFLGTGTPPIHTEHLAPGAMITPTFAGQKGGPLRVKATVDDGYYTKPAKVIASQRVLSSGGTAFNEEPGIPASRLSDRYEWPWYDMTSAGANSWVLIANPNSQPIFYHINLGNATIQIVGSGPIAPGETVFHTFPGFRGGPLEVKTYFDPNNSPGTPADSIATQRSIWGPSFEESPGMDYHGLKTSYAWTWYDQLSSGASNWVLVANPSTSETITATISFINQANSQAVIAQSPDIGPRGHWEPQFDGKMGGPVKVTAVKKNTSEAMDIITSQRVLWNGYFNEVWGQ